MSHLRNLTGQAILTACVLIFSHSTTFAQTVAPPLPRQAWSVEEMTAASGNYYSIPSWKHSILYLADGGFAFAAGFGLDEAGIVRISGEGKTLWQTKLTGTTTTGISKLGDNFLVITSDINGGNDNSTQVTAFIVDGTKGSILKQKVIFTSPEPVYTDSKILKDQDGKGDQVFIRVSNSSRSGIDYGKNMRQRLATEKLALITLDAELNATQAAIPSLGKDGLYIGSVAGTNKEFYLCSVVDDQMIMECFKSDGSKKDRLMTAISVRDALTGPQPIITIDPSNPAIVFVGMKYETKGKDDIHNFFEFNFSKKNVTNFGEQKLTGKYGKSIEYTALKGLERGERGYESGMKINDVLATPDRIVVVKEIMHYKTSTKGSNWLLNEGVSVDIYDRQWKLLKTVGINRSAGSYTNEGRSTGARVEGKKLVLVMSAFAGFMKAGTAMAVINLENGEMEKLASLDHSGVDGTTRTEGSATFFTAGGFYLTQIIERGKASKGYHYDTILQKVTY